MSYEDICLGDSIMNLQRASFLHCLAAMHLQLCQNYKLRCLLFNQETCFPLKHQHQ